MKIGLDRSACVGHVQCSAIGPDVLTNDDLGHTVLLAGGVVLAGVEEDAQPAVDPCLEQALRVTEP